MSLRVTQGMMHMQLMRNLNRNLSQMEQLQQQTTTGRKINKASDDPVGITYSLRYRAELSANEQYQKNVDSALSWLDFNDTVLSQAGDVLERVKELATQASNGTNPDVALTNIKSEVEQLKTQLIDIANSKINGKYVFNGENFNQIPFDKSKPGFNARMVSGDSGTIEYAVGNQIKLDINLTAEQVFGAADLSTSGTGDNVFSVLDRIISALGSTDYAGVAAELPNIEKSADRFLNAQAEIGARVNRVELMQNRLSDMEINLTDLQSKVEDADFEKLLIDTQINENIYQASLSVGAKVIKQSLVDFLR
ncbi:flagellar hook-associated protein FlgL [Paenibacillus nanensis]|uniref:Flagellar hook-associated protein FlgL n=1 Tax=Paenibacillus nanensis TaxID=393251 RepID=A0A3A1UP50_9BACL|nr:flagellar hook-associated protein FlgL [Paenibacillus nanensis]RIX47296.1 flagellar hook-associated protein FlgL [Paenibacillus nanensis]